MEKKKSPQPYPDDGFDEMRELGGRAYPCSSPAPCPVCPQPCWPALRVAGRFNRDAAERAVVRRVQQELDIVLHRYSEARNISRRQRKPDNPRDPGRR